MPVPFGTGTPKPFTSAPILHYQMACHKKKNMCFGWWPQHRGCVFGEGALLELRRKEKSLLAIFISVFFPPFLPHGREEGQRVFLFWVVFAGRKPPRPRLEGKGIPGACRFPLKTFLEGKGTDPFLHLSLARVAGSFMEPTHPPISLSG